MPNLFAEIPDNLAEEVFQILLQQDSLKIERIISKGHRSPASEWYDQGQNEWVMVVKGKAEIAFADSPSVLLSPGDYLNIPARTKHRVDWTDPTTETIWLAVHY